MFVFSLLISLILEVVGGSGAGPPPGADINAFKPNVDGFKQVLSKELEFRIDDYRTAFVGRVVDYQNPDKPNKFIRVYYRQVAIISERSKLTNITEGGGPNRNLSNLNYHRKQETEALGRVQQATDVFAYVQWQTVRDSRTGQDIRTGSMQIWLLGQNGVWVYHTQPAGTKSVLEPSVFSEPSKDKKSVIVGLKFTLKDTVHIVRIGQDEVLSPVKKKGAVNDKK